MITGSDREGQERGQQYALRGAAGDGSIAPITGFYVLGDIRRHAR